MKIRSFVSAAAVAFAVMSASALDATVVSVSGKVEVQVGSEWKPLSQGQLISKGSVISTGFKSEAVFSVKGSQFTLGPLTRATLENLISTQDKDSTQIYIDSGSLKADVNGQDGKRVGFKVRSPVATASVRGTSFNMTCSGRLSVSKGLVSYGPAERKDAYIPESVTAVEETSFELPPAGEAPSAAVAAEIPSPANVVADAPSASEPAPAPTAPAPKTTAFTSVRAVGEPNGIPVAKGQKSKVSKSGDISTPVAEKRVAAAPKAVVPLSVSEAVVSSGSGNGSALNSVAAVEISKESAVKEQKGSLSVTVVFE